MADYYSLLARAVAALPQPGPEARQAVYERARIALMNQLRSIQPPVADADIASEGRALDEAIARLELELVKNGNGQPPSQQASKTAPPPQPAKTAPPPRPQTAQPRPPFSRTPTPGDPARLRPAQPEAPEPEDEDFEPDKPIEPRERQRPAAPLPPLPRPPNGSRRLLAILAILTVVAGIVGLAAWQLRERPEELATLAPEEGTSESGSAGKIADRVGDAGERAKTSAPSATKSSGGGGVPIAQKAELWVSAPEEASKVKTYPGSVVWRLENVGQGPGQATTSAIRGDIDIPDAKLKLTLLFQKNSDAALSATHTVNVSFQLAPSSDLKGVKAIGQIQMRRPEAQNGEKIVGIPVPITENNFLIGLMRGDREARNLFLLRAPMILDLPMQLSDGRAATISIEKGPVGERVFSDAIDQWSRR
jgi:hypothetical protein